MNIARNNYFDFSSKDNYSIDELNDYKQALQETITYLQHRGIGQIGFLFANPFYEIVSILEREITEIDMKIDERMSQKNYYPPELNQFPHTYIPTIIGNEPSKLEQRVEEIESKVEKIDKKIDNSMLEFHQEMDKNMPKVNHVSDYITSVEMTKEEKSNDESE